MNPLRSGLFVALCLSIPGAPVLAVGEGCTKDLAAIQAVASEGRPGLALERLEALLETDPGEGNGAFLKGILLARLDRTEEAIEVFEELLERYPDSLAPRNNLAVLYARRGDLELATQTLLNAVYSDRGFRAVFENLNSIHDQVGNGDGALEEGALSLVAQPEKPLPTRAPTLRAVAPKEPLAGHRLQAGRIFIPAEPLAGAPTDRAEARGTEPSPPLGPSATIQGTDSEPGSTGVVPSSSSHSVEPDERLADILTTVGRWADAWSGQRVDDYLSAYSSAFEPPDGMTLGDWRQIRRARIQAPSFIEVDLESPRVTDVRDLWAEVRFTQHYNSSSFQDTVVKVLEVMHEEGRWKILREYAEQ